MVERERAGHRLLPRRALREPKEHVPVALLRQRGPRVGEAALDPPEQRDRRSPGLSVPRPALGTQVGAECQELGQLGDHTHVPLGGDADEAVGVEVVAEEDAGVTIGGREEPRPAVVQQVALVDRLDSERELLVGERGEDRELLPLFLRTERGGPESTLGARLECDRLPKRRRRQSQAASSLAQYEMTTSAPARLIAVRLSSAACRSSTQPRAAAAFTKAYSPLTL